MTAPTTTLRPDAGDERALRDALGRFATGIAVVTTLTPAGRPVGLTVNSFASVSLDPPLVLWSLRRNAKSFADFAQAPHFAVNILAAEQYGLSQHFARPGEKDFSAIAYAAGHGGCPILSGCLAAIECAAWSQIDGGDHVILVGRVEAAAWRAGDPLVFSAGTYGTHRPFAAMPANSPIIAMQAEQEADV